MHHRPWRPRHDGHRGEGIGRQKGQTEIYRGAEYTVQFLPKVKVEVVVASDGGARDRGNHVRRPDRKIGDGKIFVFDVEEAVRIRTGDTDTNAL